GSIDNYVTGVSECSQQRGSLKDNGYNCFNEKRSLIIIPTLVALFGIETKTDYQISLFLYCL
ncbi:hypothetical protein, partial [Photorhabdus antumapuensis]|uniref:hypothetical protein n=1 Tax=Photorhabdus antumapuensis TaxID=2862867 RepID=UPI001CEDF0ED